MGNQIRHFKVVANIAFTYQKMELPHDKMKTTDIYIDDKTKHQVKKNYGMLYSKPQFGQLKE